MTLQINISQQLAQFTLQVAFEAESGITTLFGPSGCGKTTVVNAIAGLTRPDAGHITFNNTPLFDSETKVYVPPHKRRMGYVFQDGRLFPHLSVAQNLRYGARFAPIKSSTSFDDAVALLDLSTLLDRAPGDLSGGEKQRVAIGRALLSAPQMLLMDEPLAALDQGRKRDILPYLERLRDETGLPILYVSHAVDEIARLAQKIIVMDQGQIVAQGSAEAILSDPSLTRHFGVRDAGAVIPATVKMHHPDGLTELSCSGGALFLPKLPMDEGTPTRVRILAQDVMLARQRPTDISALNILPVEIRSLQEGSGPGVMVQLSSGGDLMLARITRRSAKTLALSAGDQLFAVIKSVSVAQQNVGSA